jgi:hypothetical protein
VAPSFGGDKFEKDDDSFGSHWSRGLNEEVDEWC